MVHVFMFMTWCGHAAITAENKGAPIGVHALCLFLSIAAACAVLALMLPCVTQTGTSAALRLWTLSKIQLFDIVCRALIRPLTCMPLWHHTCKET